MNQYNQETVDKLEDIKFQIELAIMSVKQGGCDIPMTATEVMESRQRYGRDAIVVGDYVITKRFLGGQSDFMLDTLTQAVRDVAHAIRGLGTNRDLLSKLERMENRIMSAVTDSIKQFRDAYAAACRGLRGDINESPNILRPGRRS